MDEPHNPTSVEEKNELVEKEKHGGMASFWVCVIGSVCLGWLIPVSILPFLFKGLGIDFIFLFLTLPICILCVGIIIFISCTGIPEEDENSGVAFMKGASFGCALAVVPPLFLALIILFVWLFVRLSV